MNYQEFKNQLLELLGKEFGQDITLTVQDIVKNNGIHQDGLTVITESLKVSPTIYLNHFFRQYEKGKPMAEICHDILCIYRENRPLNNIDISFFTNYDNVKSHIIFKLINYQKNDRLLQDVPHLRLLDLAVVFCCLLKSDYTGNATILIHNHHLHYWNITTDDLFALAQDNTPRLLKPELRNMADVLCELFCARSPQKTPADVSSSNMYVLTNESKLNGAVCILYPDLLRRFADTHDSDVYILPSSVHEVMLISARVKSTPKELNAMVEEVNCSQLMPEEVLSNHAYYYDRQTGQIQATF